MLYNRKKYISPQKNNIIQVSLHIGWDKEQAKFYSELYYVYSQSRTVQWYI